MTGFPGSPRLLKGGLVLMDATTSTVQRIIAMQYNPDSVSRTLQIQGVGPDSGDRSELLRIKGPPVETWKVDAELDATDQLEIADATVSEVGLQAQLAALEIIVYPTSTQLQNLNSQAQSGTLEHGFPQLLSGARVYAVETVGGSSAAGQHAGFGSSGLWLAPRLHGLAEIAWEVAT